MDPFTIALATFGIQKLRGKSTKRSFRDALLMGTLGGAAGAAGIQGFGTFGQGLQTYGLSQTPTAAALGAKTTAAELGTTIAPRMAEQASMQALQAAGGTPGALAAGSTPAAISAAPVATSSVSPSFFGGIKQGITNLLPESNTGRVALAAAGVPLVMSAMGGEDGDLIPPGFTEEDYKKALEEAKGQVAGIGSRATPQSSGYVYPYTYNTGGIVNAMPKFNQGGINYLPSKSTHDEHDVHNYTRAAGYVEDGSGNGDKDEDTILAQLADGEFVSRADAILGAGIMEGASPSSMKDMRKKGAAFFYDQQAKFKRVYDLLNASRKDN